VRTGRNAYRRNGSRLNGSQRNCSRLNCCGDQLPCPLADIKFIKSVWNICGAKHKCRTRIHTYVFRVLKASKNIKDRVMLIDLGDDDIALGTHSKVKPSDLFRLKTIMRLMTRKKSEKRSRDTVDRGQ